MSGADFEAFLRERLSEELHASPVDTEEKIQAVMTIRNQLEETVKAPMDTSKALEAIKAGLVETHAALGESLYIKVFGTPLATVIDALDKGVLKPLQTHGDANG